MGWFDWIDSVPVVSQIKSAVQAMSGDTDGARRTQEKFLTTAPGVSQVKSLVQVIQGDTDGARRTQEQFAGNAVDFLADGGVKFLPIPGAAFVGALLELRKVVGVAAQLTTPQLDTSSSLTPRPEWMASEGVQALCLHEMLIPGTHDSGTFRFKEFVPEAAKFSQAQKLTIRQQLDGGIRYIDLRLDNDGNTLRCAHKFFTVPLDEVYGDVRDFLAAHPSEKVILAHQWDGEGNGTAPGQLDAAKALADKYFLGRYVRPSSLYRPIGAWDSQESVLYLQRHVLDGAEDWGAIVRNSWDKQGDTPGTNSPSPETAVRSCITWAIAHPRTVCRLNLLACQGTPPDDIIGNVKNVPSYFQRSDIGLEPMAGRSNYIVATELLTNRAAMANANVINMDFANDQVIGAIVAMNPTTLEQAGCGSVAENATVQLDDSCYVVYGANGKYKHGFVAPSQVAFDNATFGDPCPGTAKRGYYKKTVVPMQDNWRWCRACSVMFYPVFNRGVCPGNPQGHVTSPTNNYTLTHDSDIAPGQDNWHHCPKCQALHWAGGDGHCPAAGAHTHTKDGFNYRLAHDPKANEAPLLADRGQPQWRFCSNCFSMFYDGFREKGRCAAGGLHNIDPSTSYNYRIEYRGPAPAPPATAG